MDIDLETLIDTLRTVLAEHGLDTKAVEAVTLAYAAALLKVQP